MIRTFAILLLFTAGGLMTGCKGNSPDEPVDSFDQGEMLDQMSDEVILPYYNELNEAVTGLKSAANTFEDLANESSHAALKTRFVEAYVAWQYCAGFEFGPAAERNLRLTLNTYPVDTAQIESNIDQGNYDLSIAANSDAKGFPALDYVLFHSNTPSLAETNRLEYVLDNIQLIQDDVQYVVDSWNDSYQGEFSSSLGTDVGSSLGQLVNELNLQFELVKNAKVGIPLGKKSLGVAQPEAVEAVYSRQSLQLIGAALEGIENTFSGAQGQGLDDYLDHLDAQHESGLLSVAIMKGFEDINAALDAIEGPLDDAIENRTSQVEELHAALQNQVVLLKTDMPSQLGVQITYQDNDGD